MKEALSDLKEWLEILIPYELNLILLAKQLDIWLGQKMPIVMASVAVIIVIVKAEDIWMEVCKMFKSNKRRRKRKRKKKGRSFKKIVKSFI